MWKSQDLADNHYRMVIVRNNATFMSLCNRYEPIRLRWLQSDL